MHAGHRLPDGQRPARGDRQCERQARRSRAHGPGGGRPGAAKQQPDGLPRVDDLGDGIQPGPHHIHIQRSPGGLPISVHAAQRNPGIGMQLARQQRGFTLTELAVVFTIIALLIGGGMMTLSAQVEQRNNDETVRRLNAAAEAVLAYAIVNRQFPCPAVAGATGDEAPAGGGACTNWYGGFLPARTIGFQPTDPQGYGVDVWGNRIRYAMANLITGCTGGPPALPHFTSQLNLKA
ncbi:MAG: type II secretion system protein, partial [Chloroflexi bacterium]